MPDPAEITEADLRRLAEGLTYTSETDAPVEPIRWPRGEAGDGGLSKADVLRLAGLPADSRVTTMSVQAFFKPVAEEAEWQDEEERLTAQRFQEMADALATLRGVKVYKVGKNPMDVYVLGQTKEGDVVGVKTRVVET